MPPVHKNLADGRWFEFSILEQMGNIGSEVGRAIMRHKEGDEKRFNSAFDRALELFDLTISDSRWRGPRLREICRAREIFCDLFFGGNQFNTDPDSLDRYFTRFAMAARFQRDRKA